MIGFADVLRFADRVQKCTTRKKTQAHAHSLGDSQCSAAACGIRDVWLEKVLEINYSLLAESLALV